uniref:Uncharacterized protein n=1 Tax=Avena sativa TaxID=4498 RepID=A0ACD5TEV3_AVESA
MAAGPWLLLLCLVAGAALQARAQPDSKGFITVDCGLSEETGYVDDTTKFFNVPDAGFIDTGTNHNISAEYVVPIMLKTWYSVRSFAGAGVRNCYTLRSLEPGLKYMVRARFLYGNYDRLDRFPAFDLYIGVNYWLTVNISGPDAVVFEEAIVVVPENFLQVCLVDIGAGAPFISGLDLRPLKRTLYPHVTPAQGLTLVNRLNFGPTNQSSFFRYPVDPHDRIWDTFFPKYREDPLLPGLERISTTERVRNDDFFEVPSAVLQTAIVPPSVSGNIYFTWYPRPTRIDPTPGHIVILHFAELQVLPRGSVRQLNVTLNDKPWYTSSISPFYLSDLMVNNTVPFNYDGRYKLSVEATSNSTLPPILNAAEVFSVFPTTNLSTDSQDVSAITAIKAKYRVTKNWMGDPCVPNDMAWDRLTCSYGATGSRPRITSVNLSSSDLNGDISLSFTNLKAVQYLDLSNNNLIGSIPDALSQLPSLTLLDLSGNQLDGSIPSGLLKKSQDGSLNLRYRNNPKLCPNGNSCQLPPKKNSKLALYIAVPAVLLVVIVLVTILLICLLKEKKQGSMNNSITPQNETMTDHGTENVIADDRSLRRLESRRFTYKELEMITNNFQQVLGQGGFGYVYSGFLEDGTQVAVKLRSHSSNQGVKEFLAEAEILTRIHHMNLVSMIGYCMDGEYMALVYEYMSEGTLQEHIEGM